MKTTKIFFLLLLFFNLVSVYQFAQNTRWIDDIVPDTTLDDSTFKLCNANEQIIQYFNDGKGIQYVGGKPAIDSIFFSNYRTVKINESGLIRIRFVVNCSGETGRFRLLSSDINYQPKEFTSEITNQLLRISKSMNNWQPKKWKDTKVDYYQYLICKIDNGELTHILP